MFTDNKSAVFLFILFKLKKMLSKFPYALISLLAVTRPIPLTPLMLSELSPISAFNVEKYCGSKPYLFNISSFVHSLLTFPL